jgi:hypothetical protein
MQLKTNALKTAKLVAPQRKLTAHMWNQDFTQKLRESACKKGQFVSKNLLHISMTQTIIVTGLAVLPEPPSSFCLQKHQKEMSSHQTLTIGSQTLKKCSMFQCSKDRLQDYY